MSKYRALFLTLSSVIALAVGCFALLFPRALLAGKGVVLPNAAAEVWVRQVGVNILALGTLLFLVRRHAWSPTLRAVFIGNIVVQVGLLPIELAGYLAGALTESSGVVPSSVLHVVLAAGFGAFAVLTKAPGSEGPRLD
jgi:hypothetical protein